MKITGLAFALLAAAAAPSYAQSADDAAVGNSAPDYSSDFRRGTLAIPSSAGNTPEDDARPGEYYFRIGASAFVRKDYKYAIDMYRVAASWAYKPAEFNLGVIYARGQGVPVDLPRAMAWMALAAERNDAEYVQGREVVYSQLTKEQFEQANAIWRELRKTYGDETALARAKQRWAQVRANATGSHVGSVGPGLMVGTAPTHVAKLPPTSGAGGAPGPVATSGADVLSGDRSDGSVAYRQLRESDNPYDPKFERPAAGTASVGALQPVDSKDAAKDDPAQR